MNPDFKELLLIFNAHDVDYLIVGAHALAAYGHVRATKDLDLWVRPDPQNAAKVLTSLSAFGAPLGELTLGRFKQRRNGLSDRYAAVDRDTPSSYGSCGALRA